MLRALKRHGLIGTLRLIPQHLHRHPPSPPSAFDQQWGTETDGNEDLRDLQITADRDALLYGTRYQASSEHGVRDALTAGLDDPNGLVRLTARRALDQWNRRHEP